jgi:hypothetical protein
MARLRSAAIRSFLRSSALRVSSMDFFARYAGVQLLEIGAQSHVHQRGEVAPVRFGRQFQQPAIVVARGEGSGLYPECAGTDAVEKQGDQAVDGHTQRTDGLHREHDHDDSDGHAHLLPELDEIDLHDWLSP